MQDTTEVMRVGAHTAGMFEIGGHLGLQVIDGDRVEPLSRIGDTNTAKLLAIQGKLGGKIHPRGGNSHSWETRKEETLLIARSMELHALYRLPYIEAIKAWSTTDDFPILMEITRELQAYNQAPEFPSIEEYIKALRDDMFLAGCFVNRGRRLLNGRTQINSFNKPLLKAIQITLEVPGLLGYFESVYEPGDISNFADGPYVLHKGAYRIMLGVHQTYALLERIQDADYVYADFISRILDKSYIPLK